MRLSLREGALKVLENSLDIVIERISPEIAGARAEGSIGAFEPEAFGSFKREDSEEPLSSRASVSAGGRKSTKSESYALEAGVSGKTGYGTEYSLTADEDWVADTFNAFDFEYSTFAGVRLKQPLLKDFGPDAARLDVRITSKDRDISIYRFKKRVMDVITDYELAYWALVRVREELGLKEESLRLAETLLRDNRKRLDLGVISPLELTQAEAAVAVRKDELIAGKKAVRERENALKIQISKDVFGIKDAEIIPADEPSAPPLDAALEESFGYAVKSRPDYLELKSEIEKGDIRVRYASNQKMPRIDLEASYGFNGIGPSFGESWDGINSNPEWSVGLSLRYPLGNTAALSELKASRLEASRSLLRLKQLEQEMILGIDNSIKEVRAQAERIESTRESTRLSLLSLRAEEKKLEAGRSTTYNVLKLQEDLMKAKTNEAGALIEYNTALANYYKERGEVLERLGIGVSGPDNGLKEKGTEGAR